MIYKPHSYQCYATNYIENHLISAILLDMGLGKTVITLTALENLLFDSFDVHKVLIIAPLRVGRDTWPAEVRKWDHLHELVISVVIGDKVQRLKALKTKADIYIINRENVSWLIEQNGINFDFDTVVVDELSSFKNYQAKRFRSLMKVRPKVKRIIGLTGTPSSNGLMDLFAEFKLLDMGKRLGRFITDYRNTYFIPDKRNGQVIYSYKPLPFAEQEIYKKIDDITISMKSDDYLEMPELISNEYTVYMDECEIDKYKTLAKELILELGDNEITVANAASLSNKLSQMANGAVYNDDGGVDEIHDRKLDGLEDLIEAANGKPVLVAYWFKHDYSRICKRLDDLGIIYAKLDTSESIDKWNEGKIPVGLVHPASAGHGLNLQEGGSTIIWFGLTWSLELYQQTNARLYRQGQNDSTVVIEHIITAGTIDEKIMKVLSKKNKVQSDLIDAVKAILDK